MTKPDPKYKATFQVSCCDFNSVTDYEFDAIVDLLSHVKRHHRKMYSDISTRARELARSQNGKGYYDSGEPENDGWHKAPESFRESHRRRALKERLKI